MPTYEYECGACGECFEVQQRITDDPLASCPKCGKKGRIQRLISVSQFVLKGSGWAKDGYSSVPPTAKGGGRRTR